MAQGNRKNLLVIHATWFLFWSVDQLLLLHWFGLDWKRALTDAVATNFLLVAAGIATANVTRFYAPVKKNFFYRILMVLGLATICTAGVIKLLYFVFPSTDEWIAFLKISAPVRFAFAVRIDPRVVFQLFRVIAERPGGFGAGARGVLPLGLGG